MQVLLLKIKNWKRVSYKWELTLNYRLGIQEFRIKNTILKIIIMGWEHDK